MGNSFGEDFKGTERFLIQRRLGSGGFGVVYQAYDHERSTQVALKTLHQANAETLYLFKQEFRSLADVIHPNLITLYELMSADDLWFFTMELIEGVDFLAYARDANQQIDSSDEVETIKMAHPKSDLAQNSELETLKIKPMKMENPTVPAKPQTVIAAASFNLDRLKSALKQLAEGISAVHQAGKLHRDIKPSNVLVTKAGRVVLLDYGLITDLTAYGTHQSLNIVGTPAYMSPEQAIGEAVSKASDWYSVGVMLYQSLTGQLPFADNMQAMLMEKQQREPLPPKALAADIPEDLNALCQQLLRRSPRQRAGWTEILDYLGTADGGNQIIAPIIAPMSDALLIGRERHLAALTEACQDMKAGRAVTIYVNGRSGMGKSALVRYFLDELRKSQPDMVVLTGRCFEQESVPYKALDSIIDALSQYLKRLSRLEAEALLPLDVLALARLFPVLQQVEAVAGARRRVLEIPDSQELRRRAFTALRELLARMANKKPLALFIDDLQWGDIDSATLLLEILHPPDPPALLLIGSYRSEQTETSPFLKAIRSPQAIIGAAIDAREVVVGELSVSEAKNLAMALSQPSAISNAQAEAIARESGGNPFFVSELVWHSKSFQGLETSLEEVIQARVGQLPAAARRLLEIVAVAGQPLARPIAKQAATLDNDESKTLALLRASHMIRMASANDREEIETYHDRIRETIVAHLSADILKSHHHLLAISLEASNRADAERLTTHFQQAGDNEKAAQYAIIAADQAAQALAFDRAAGLYKLALQLKEMEIDQAQNFRVKLGNALANAGRGGEAAQAYLAAAQHAVAAEAIDLERRAAEQLLICGLIDEGLPIIGSVLDKVGLKLPTTRNRALLLLLWQRIKIWLRGLEFRQRGVDQISSQELMRIDICWSVANGLSLVNLIYSGVFSTHHLLLALKAGEPYRISLAIALEAIFIALGGVKNRSNAEALLQKSKALAKQINHPYAIGLTSRVAGSIAALAGDWQTGRELSEKAEIILREQCIGVDWELNWNYVYLYFSLFNLGEINEIFDHLPADLKEAQEKNNLYGKTFLILWPSTIVLLAEDFPDKARREADEAIHSWSHNDYQLLHCLYLLSKTQIFLYSNENIEAWNFINEQWPTLARSHYLRVQVILIFVLHLRARSALAAAVNGAQTTDLLNVAEADAGSIEREKTTWGDAIAKLIRAGIATARGDKVAALAMLDSAEKALEVVNMTLYAVAAKRRRGQLISGEAGAALIAEADEWMIKQKIKNPLRMAAMLAPGQWQS